MRLNCALASVMKRVVAFCNSLRSMAGEGVVRGRRFDSAAYTSSGVAAKHGSARGSQRRGPYFNDQAISPQHVLAQSHRVHTYAAYYSSLYKHALQVKARFVSKHSKYSTVMHFAF